MLDRERAIRGRGASWNPANRFEPRAYETEEALDETLEARPETRYLPDATKSIIAYNDSPDVGFEASVNPYRGCEHGCVYCYARPFHEYLGLSAGTDFETQIFYKERAPELLRKELSAKKWRPQVIAMSGVTDCYQPVERKLELTRQCLMVLAEFRNPVGIVTKNALVQRDIDVLSKMAEWNGAVVFVSVTTLDKGLNRVLEPRSSLPQQRLDTIRALRDGGVPVGVLVAPIIPGLTDHETPQIIEAVAEAGAQYASYIMLRLPHAVAPLMERWLEQHYPQRKDKVLNRIKDIRDGNINDPRFSSRMKGEGLFADQIKRLFDVACDKHGLNRFRAELSTAHFRRPGSEQLSLFD